MILPESEEWHGFWFPGFCLPFFYLLFLFFIQFHQLKDKLDQITDKIY